MKRLFVDMDGTLAEWRTAAKYEDLYEKNYFFSLNPQIPVVEAVRRIATEGKAEVFILSAVLPDSKFAIQEKNDWVDLFIGRSLIDMDHRIFTTSDKPKSFFVPNGVQPSDILLDDYTVNLSEWAKHGIGVKLLNGVNHTRKSWCGNVVDMKNGKEAIYKYLNSIIMEEL